MIIQGHKLAFWCHERVELRKIPETCLGAFSQPFHLRTSSHLLRTLPGRCLWFYTVLRTDPHNPFPGWSSRISPFPLKFLFLWNISHHLLREQKSQIVGQRDESASHTCLTHTIKSSKLLNCCWLFIGLSWWLSGKQSTCQCRRCGFDPWVRIPWRDFCFVCFCCAAGGILVPQPGINPTLPAAEAGSPNHWPTREVKWHFCQVGR